MLLTPIQNFEKSETPSLKRDRDEGPTYLCDECDQEFTWAGEGYQRPLLENSDCPSFCRVCLKSKGVTVDSVHFREDEVTFFERWFEDGPFVRDRTLGDGACLLRCAWKWSSVHLKEWLREHGIHDRPSFFRAVAKEAVQLCLSDQIKNVFPKEEYEECLNTWLSIQDADVVDVTDMMRETWQTVANDITWMAFVRFAPMVQVKVWQFAKRCQDGEGDMICVPIESPDFERTKYIQQTCNVLLSNALFEAHYDLLQTKSV